MEKEKHPEEKRSADRQGAPEADHTREAGHTSGKSRRHDPGAKQPAGKEAPSEAAAQEKVSPKQKPAEGKAEEKAAPEKAAAQKQPAEQKTGAEEEVLTLKEELKTLQEQNKEYYGRLQRQQAEFDNYRKRTQKEKDELVKYAAEKVLTSMLPVVDNFERALAAAQTNSDMASFSQGVEMIFRQMQTILEQEGLKPIEAVGKPFDPNLHEAVLQVDSEDHPENTVVEELQKGYYLKDKVVRPSMVKVAR